LSGFVLAHAFSARVAGGLTAREFVALRLRRFYPVYLIATVGWLPYGIWSVAAGVRAPGPVAIDIVSALLFLPAPGGFWLFPLNLPAWTLFVELVANALLPWAIKARTGALASCVAASALLLIALAMAHGGVEGGTWPTFWLGFARAGTSFGAGILLHRLWRVRPGRPRYGAAAAAVALGGALVFHPDPADALGFDLAAIIVLFPAIIWLGADRRPPGRFIAGLCSWAGGMSYALYAIHYPLLQIARHGELYFAPALPAGAVPVIGIIAIGVIVVLATLLGRVDDGLRRARRNALGSERLANAVPGFSPRRYVAFALRSVSKRRERTSEVPANADFSEFQKVRAAPGGEPPAREPGLGTGRGGDVTGVA